MLAFLILPLPPVGVCYVDDCRSPELRGRRVLALLSTVALVTQLSTPHLVAIPSELV